MKSAVVRQAWREKIALMFIAIILWGFVAFYTLVMRQIMCPESQVNQASSLIDFDNSGGSPVLLAALMCSGDVGDTRMAV